MSELLTMKDVKRLFDSNNYVVTKQTIYNLAKEYDFMVDIGGEGYNVRFDKKKALQYLEEAIKEIPENYITIAEAAEEFNVSAGFIYLHLLKIAHKFIGMSRKVIYVDKQSTKEFIENNFGKHKK